MGKPDPRKMFDYFDNRQEKKYFSADLLDQCETEGVNIDARPMKTVDRFGQIGTCWNQAKTRIHYQASTALPGGKGKKEPVLNLPKDFYSRPSFKLTTGTRIADLPDVVGGRMQKLAKHQKPGQHDVPWYKRERHNLPIQRSVSTAPLQRHINSAYSHAMGFTTQGTNFFRQQPESNYSGTKSPYKSIERTGPASPRNAYWPHNKQTLLNNIMRQTR